MVLLARRVVDPFGTTFVFRHYNVAFICVMMIQMSKTYMINDNKSNQWSSICCIARFIDILIIIVISNV